MFALTSIESDNEYFASTFRPVTTAISLRALQEVSITRNRF